MEGDEFMKDNILYLECYSGISGDMAVASLIDLGVDLKYLKEALESVPIYGYTIKISKVKKNGVEACDFNVIIDEGHHVHRNLNDVFMIIKESKITLNAKKVAMKIFYIEAEAEAKAKAKKEAEEKKKKKEKEEKKAAEIAEQGQISFM